MVYSRSSSSHVGESSESVRFGPAGWSYPDWRGRVYGSEREGLALISTMFDVAEINATFYRQPSASCVLDWVREVAQNPTFRFTVKLWRGFTHDSFDESDAAVFRAGIEPIVEAGKLGALLMQFPWSFQFGRASSARLGRLLDLFADLPCAVEVRHASWDRREVREALRRRRAAFCSIDQPLHASSLAVSEHVTADFAYVRLHGRNVADWFRADAGRDRRYDYDYSPAELAPWAERIRRLRQVAPRVFVVTNNHFAGSAVWNALELRHGVDGRIREVPPLWLASEPRLSLFCVPRSGAQGELFARDAPR